jgi:hypothetical protein
MLQKRKFNEKTKNSEVIITLRRKNGDESKLEVQFIRTNLTSLLKHFLQPHPFPSCTYELITRVFIFRSIIIFYLKQNIY